MSEGEIPEFLVRWQDLPADIIIHKSAGPALTDTGYFAGAILKNADETAWYGADWSGPVTQPNKPANAAFWGPLESEAACRPYILSEVTRLLDSDIATDGTSDWFVPYTAPVPVPSGE